MKKAETLFGLLKICCRGYRHPSEAIGEAECFFFDKRYIRYIIYKATSAMGQSLNS